MYHWTLLQHGYSMNETNLRNLQMVKTINSNEIGWTLGYMINQTNYIPAEYREKQITKSSFTAWLTASVLLAFLTLFFLLLTCYLFCIRPLRTMGKKKNDYMQPNEAEVL